jgi:hypothetical protein
MLKYNPYEGTLSSKATEKKANQSSFEKEPT